MEIEHKKENSDFRITVLGARGSVPVEGKNFEIYGGATSCFRVQAGNEEIYLDAGSGIVNAKSEKNSRITILLTHLHLDHIVGLPFFSTLGETGRSIDIYADKRAGLMSKDAVDRLISPPFWPIKIKDYPAKVEIHNLPDKKFFIGDVAVETMEGTHPNGSTIYKLSYRGKSIVYATDFEHIPKEKCEVLTKFAADCDLLLYDAQYTEEEYKRCQGFGHSTASNGLKVAEKAGVSKLMLVHHAPWRTDKELSEMEKEFAWNNKNIMFAKIGDEIFL